MNSIIFITLLLNILLLGIFLYCLFFVDPKKSNIAKYCTITLPKQTWNILQKYISKDILNILEFFSERILLIVYIFVVNGSWVVVFTYMFPWVDQQTYLSHNHKYVAMITFVLCIFSWRKAYTSSPGIITEYNLQYYNHYPYDNIIYADGDTCRTRNIPRLARSKFDRYKYHNNIPKFDHFCGWVYNTIGEENYRWFLFFLFQHVIMLGYGTYGTLCLFYNEIQTKDLLNVVFVDRLSGIEIKSNYYIIFQYLFHNYMFEGSLLILMAVMFVALLCFLLYHCYLTSYNITTNESAKWDQVNRWYYKQLKKYNDAVSSGMINKQHKHHQQNESTKQVMDNNNKLPTIVDGDVTCTGMKASSELDENTNMEHDENIDSQQQQEEKENDENNVDDDDDDDDHIDEVIIRHLGPKPINIYNRGFYENWKEVIYPISLRKYNDDKGRDIQQSNNKNTNNKPQPAISASTTKNKVT